MRRLAGFLLLVLALASGTGWLGWQQYDEHRDKVRLHQAERDLAALELPADWTPMTQPQRCYVDAQNRCTHSSKSPDELKGALIALLHGREMAHCNEARALFPCPVYVRGTVNGYRAIGVADPDFYYPNQNPPAGASTFQKPRGPVVYLDGTRVSIVLIPDRHVLDIPGQQ